MCVGGYSVKVHLANSSWVRIEGMVSELYDTAVLPGVVRPMALGFKTREIEQLLTMDEPQAL
jgi:hypothetical protein